MNNVEELEEELEAILPPGFKIETDRNGEIIIRTGLCEDEDGELIGFDADPDAEEEDEDFDPDFEPLADEDDDDD